MSFDRKELDREEAKDDYLKHGAPTLGVDHSSHYERDAARTGATLAELTKATMKAFNIQEKRNEN